MLLHRFPKGGGKPPTFVAAGAGSGGFGAGNITPGYPGGFSLAVGDLLITAVHAFAENSHPTISGWTDMSGGGVTAGNVRLYLFVRPARSDSTETGTITVACDSVVTVAQMYAFRNVASFNTSAPNTLPGLNTVTSGGATSCGGPTLTAADAVKLWVAVFAGVAAGDVTAISGASGGSWTERADYNNSTAFVEMESSAPSAAGTISGGSASWTTGGGANAVCAGFVLPGR